MRTHVHGSSKAFGVEMKRKADYETRSRSWLLTFLGKGVAARAAGVLRSLNSHNGFLEQGSPVVVQSESVEVTWSREVKGKSMMAFLYKRCRKQFGPGGQFTPWDFRAADALQSSVAPALDGSPRSSASNSNYVKLPDVFALGASEWYADGIASSLLKLDGF